MAFDPLIKERIKQATDIVDLIGSYLQLKPEGRGFKALCPWHDDTRPSLQVNPQRQSFKCFVCDIGGDVFTFIEKLENVEFREALQILADRAGISLQPPPTAGGQQRPHGAADDKRTLYAAMAWAIETYHRCLLEAPEAAPARAYLADRNISAENVRAFQLGFAPDTWEWIASRAANTQFSQAVLERVDLIVRRPNGPGFYDRFKGRVLFPIFDAQGRAVAIGGRVLPELAKEGMAKYVNSRETPLFTKSRMLYGLSAARDAIRKTGQVLVMEGYTDCIMAHQHGFTNAVAVLGTALGAEHIQLLRRFEERAQIVCVLDGDEAGRKRANEILELFVAANADLRILTLPDDLDPCEFLLERGSNSLRELIAQSADALEHAFANATRGIDLQHDIQGTTRALEHLLAIIAKAPRLRSDTTIDHRLREERFLQRLARDFRTSEESLRDRVARLRQSSGPRRVPAAPDASTAEVPPEASLTPSKLESHERELLELLLTAPEVYERISASVGVEQLAHPHARALYQKFTDLARVGVLPDFQRLLLEFEDQQIRTLLVDLDERARVRRSTEVETWLGGVLTHYLQRRSQQSAWHHQQTLKEGRLDAQEQLAALHQILEQQRNRLGISASTDGQDAPDRLD